MPAQDTPLQSCSRSQKNCRQGRSDRHRLRCTSATPTSKRSSTGRKPERHEVRQRLRRVVDLIRIADDFAPFDRPSYNIALEVWKAVEAIPQADRHRLLGWLTRSDILDLWRLAGQRYSASPSQLQTAIHPSYYAPDQFPNQPDQGAAVAFGIPGSSRQSVAGSKPQVEWGFESCAASYAPSHPDMPQTKVVRFHGKAAVSLPYFNRFQKAFFCPHSRSELHGRVLLGKGPLGDSLYPLYYKATVGSTIIPELPCSGHNDNAIIDKHIDKSLPAEPRTISATTPALEAMRAVLHDLEATRELADLQLEYLPPSLLNLGAEDLPAAESWPQPANHKAPFDGGLVDYCRAIGPDVWVGVGWKQDCPGPGERFLHFLLAREVPDADELVYDPPKGPRGWA